MIVVVALLFALGNNNYNNVTKWTCRLNQKMHFDWHVIMICRLGQMLSSNRGYKY